MSRVVTEFGAQKWRHNWVGVENLRPGSPRKLEVRETRRNVGAPKLIFFFGSELPFLDIRGIHNRLRGGEVAQNLE
jgi:hypothetical protein